MARFRRRSGFRRRVSRVSRSRRSSRVRRYYTLPRGGYRM